MESVRKIGFNNSVLLDLIRGGSAQLVLIGHTLSFFVVEESSKIPKIQNFGVMIFFVLSGFLISQTTIIKGVGYGFKTYIIDRFSRIYAAFLPALLLILLTDFLVRHYTTVYDSSFQFTIKSFIANLFLLQNHPIAVTWGIGAFGSARPFWTVSIEWIFYIAFGILYYYSIKKIFKNPVILLLLIFSFIAVIYYVGARGGGLSYYWAFGAILSICYNKFKLQIKDSLTIVTIMIILLLSFWYRFFPDNAKEIYDVGLAANLTFILYVILNLPQTKFVNGTCNVISKFAKFLASYSYSLYLLHYTIIFLAIKVIKLPVSSYGFILIFISSNIVSYAFYWAFERNYMLFRQILKSNK